MTGPSWLNPEWLVGLAALWAALAAGVAVARVRAGRRGRRLLRGGLPATGGARDALLLVALLAIAVALLGPRIGTRSERVSTSGVDVVVLVDVSRSMDARDLPPSRLDRARQAAGALLAGLEPGDRAALAAFAGRGVLLTPLSPDHAALADLLPALDTDWIEPAASDLGAGLREALTAFDPASDRPRVVLVLSDGEDPSGASDAGRAAAERAGARVVAVALGSEAGATLPGEGGALRDGRGRVVTTRADAARLARLAEATGGTLLRPDTLGAVDAAALRAAVRRDAPGPGAGETVERRVPAVRVAPFAGAALLLLVLEAVAAARGAARTRTRAAPPAGTGPARPAGTGTAAPAGARSATPAVATALVAAMLLGASAPEPGSRSAWERFRRAPAEAPRSLADDPRALLARGLALARAERWAEAERAFRAAALAARDAGLAADAYHDAGVAALRDDRLEDARDAFLESVAAAPSQETRFNLEWTLRALAAEAPPPPPGRSGEPDASEPSDGARPAPGAELPDPAPGPTDAADTEPGAPEAAPETREATAPPEDAPAAQAGEPGPRGREAAPPPMSDAEAARWLARASDDAARALRGLAGDGTERAEPDRGPAW